MSSSAGRGRGVEVGHRQQVPHAPAPAPSALSAARRSATPSRPSVSVEQHDDLLAAGGGHVLADVVGADRQLAVPAVDEHGQLHRARTPVLAQRVERGAHRPAGEQHVVDQHDQPVVDAAVGQRGVAERAGGAAAQVVAVERGVDRADGGGDAGELGDRGGQPAGEHRSAGRDADDHELVGVVRPEGGLLDDLVRDARDGAGDVGGAEQLPVGSGGAPARPRGDRSPRNSPSPPHRTGLKERTRRCRGDGPGRHRAAVADRIPVAAAGSARGHPDAGWSRTVHTGPVPDRATLPQVTPGSPMSISRSSGLGLFGPLDGPRGLTRRGAPPRITLRIDRVRPGGRGLRGAPPGAPEAGAPRAGRTHHAALDVGPAADASEEGGRHMGDYAKALGSKLRAIRQQQGLSLHGVEQKSGGRWKAVVVGSYERGDRAVTVQKLAELADFYGVPVAELLPEGRVPSGSEPAHEDRHQPGAPAAAARRQGRPARPLRRRDPEPARRLQRQGPLDPGRGPAFAGDHLRQDARRADRPAHRLGRPAARGPPRRLTR